MASSSTATQPASFAERDPAPADPSTPAIQLVGAARAFGPFRALSGVSLTVQPGERVAVIGPSGAGKTTLLRLANTSLFASAGEVRLLGQDVRRLGSRALRSLRGRIGTVYQQLQLVPQASVLENVLMGRLGRRSALATAAAALRRRDREEVAAVLSSVGIADKLDERLDRLSGGEQQRVAVARVLYQGPEIVLADEPFSSVDPERSHAVVQLLAEAARGRTLLLSTHQLEPVLPHFPRVIGLREGRVLFDKRRGEVAAADLALLYQPEAATRSDEARSILPARAATRRPTEIRVGASTTPGACILPSAVAAFARLHPRVQVRLMVKDTAEVVRHLSERGVDLAFVGGRSHHPDLHFEDFAEDEIILVAAPDFGGLPDPLPASLAARLPRVDREPGSSTRAIVEGQFAGMGAALDPASSVFEAGSVASLIGAVSAGLGVGFASRRSVESALEAGLLREVRVDAVKVPRRFFVAWRRGEVMSEAASTFLELARRTAAAR
jgi:phosphonate transport system ATP-binding protein